MRVSCACPREMASDGLVERIIALGLQPIVTSQIVRAVYEGDDRKLGIATVELFRNEVGHEINVQFQGEEERKIERKLARKYERAKRNAELHGHEL